MTAFVYVIGPESGPFKIGVAGNVKDRLSGLQVANPTPLYIHAMCAVGTRHEAFAAESNLHLRMKRVNLRGEWISEKIEAVLAVMVEIGLSPFNEIRLAKDRNPRELEIRDWLLGLMKGCSEDTIKKLGELHGIPCPTPEAIADFRAIQIIEGNIVPYAGIFS